MLVHTDQSLPTKKNSWLNSSVCRSSRFFSGISPSFLKKNNLFFFLKITSHNFDNLIKKKKQQIPVISGLCQCVYASHEERLVKKGSRFTPIELMQQGSKKREPRTTTEKKRAPNFSEIEARRQN